MEFCCARDGTLMPKGNNAIANITSERVVILILLILFNQLRIVDNSKTQQLIKKVLVIVTECPLLADCVEKVGSCDARGSLIQSLHQAGTEDHDGTPASRTGCVVL
jgi:hypothetical protein